MELDGIDPKRRVYTKYIVVDIYRVSHQKFSNAISLKIFEEKVETLALSAIFFTNKLFELES